MATLRTRVYGSNIMITSEEGRRWTLRHNNFNTVNRTCAEGHAHALVLHSLTTAVATCGRLSAGERFDGSPCYEFTTEVKPC